MSISYVLSKLAAQGSQPGGRIAPVHGAFYDARPPTVHDLYTQFHFPVITAIAPQRCILRPPRFIAGVAIQIATDCTIAPCVVGATLGLLILRRNDQALHLLTDNILPVVTFINVSSLVTAWVFSFIIFRFLRIGMIQR